MKKTIYNIVDKLINQNRSPRTLIIAALLIDLVAIIAAYFAITALWGCDEETDLTDTVQVLPVEPVSLVPHGYVDEISYYHKDYEGKTTAYGDIFTNNAYTCASWEYPEGTQIVFKYGKEKVMCIVTDKGPRKDLVRDKGREFDLSQKAFFTLIDEETGRREGILRDVRVFIVREET